MTAFYILKITELLYAKTVNNSSYQYLLTSSRNHHMSDATNNVRSRNMHCERHASLTSNAAQAVTLHASDFTSILETFRPSANTRGTVSQTVNSGLYIYLFRSQCKITFVK